MIRSTPAGKACVNSARLMVLASMGRQVSHPTVASGGSRRGCRLCSRASLWAVAVWASGSMSAHVYEATAWPALRTASSHVAMPPRSSTRWICRWGRMDLGMVARAWGGVVSFGGGREVLGIPNINNIHILVY